jgi:hypothetical protein
MLTPEEFYLKKLHILISIMAAFVMTAICIFRQESLYTMAIVVSVTIVVFYVIGAFVRAFVDQRVFPEPTMVQTFDDYAHLMDMDLDETGEPIEMLDLEILSEEDEPAEDVDLPMFDEVDAGET